MPESTDLSQRPFEGRNAQSREGPGLSLTVVNAASSEKTLDIMLMMAALGLPFVLTCTATIHWVFRGKVQISQLSD